MRQVILYPDVEDGGYVVEVPSLPGCVSQGETKDEALHNIQDAMAAWVDAAKQTGIAIPEEHFDVQVMVMAGDEG